MLSISNPTSSVESPLLITEKSRDFETILLIITGRPRDAIHRPDSWKQAVKLYRMMEKYQLDGHQPWFSEICALWLHEDPIDALFLACNRPSIDVVLARRVIADGFANATTDQLRDPEYCRQRGPSSSESEAKHSKARRRLLDPSNMTVRFGLDIGYKGLLAYNFTFAGLGTRENPEAWTALAVRFVETARKIEMEISARRVSIVMDRLTKIPIDEFFLVSSCTLAMTTTNQYLRTVLTHRHHALIATHSVTASPSDSIGAAGHGKTRA